MENEELRRARFSGWELPPMRETNETIDAAELARRYDALLADRDRLAAENARLREAVTAIAAAKLRYEASSLVFGEEHHALMDAIAAARSLVEAPR